MGRVARYKKVKKSLSKAAPRGVDRISIHVQKDSKKGTGSSGSGGGGSGGDYFDRVGVWGLGDSGRQPKKRSLASIKLRTLRNKKIPDAKELYDLKYTDGDDFDMNDLMGSLRKEQQPMEVTTFTSTSYASSSSTGTNATTTGTTTSTSSLMSKDTDTSETSIVIENEPSTAGGANSQTLARSQEEQQQQSNDTPTKDSTTSASASTRNTIEVEEERLHKKFETQVRPNISTIVKSHGRMIGESKNAYSKRVKQETRQIIQRANQQAHNPEKRLRKKEFLTMKKKMNSKNRKKRKATDDDDDNNNNNNNGPDNSYDYNDDTHTKTDNSGISTTTTVVKNNNSNTQYNSNNNNKPVVLTGEQAVAVRERMTRVQFGEQAERPPQFTQLPRGAVVRNKNNNKSQPTTTTTKNGGNQLVGNNNYDHDQEAVMMDRMRRKVQAQYAEMKARRRGDGDFHL